MKKALIVHGWPTKEEYADPERPSPSNCHWIPWIQRELVIRGVNAQALEMPDASVPVYGKWKSAIENFAIDEETILVGHSCGGGFWIRWLSENKKSVGRVALVAPWIDPTGELDTGFFDFEIDPELIGRTAGLTVMYSTDDDPVILETIRIFKEKLPGAEFKEFSNKGHFCLDDLGTEEFPELRNELIS